MPKVALAILLIILYNFTTDFLAISNNWGEWDAWSIWNLHAKFLMSPTYFKQLFSPTLYWSHPDYPLMLPSIVAMYWHGIGVMNTQVPLMVAYCTAILLLLLTFSAFYQKKMTSLGLIVVYLLCNSEGMLLPFSAAQYADTLLALLILLSIILYEYTMEVNARILLITGFTTALCAWVKNEGLVFFILFSIGIFITFFKQQKKLLQYLLGSTIPLLFVLYFKLQLATDNDIFNSNNQISLSQIFNISRFLQIWEYISTYMNSHSTLLLSLIVLSILFHARYFISIPFLVLFTLFISYIFVYVFTPYDLDWHLSTSFDRLLFQISPAFIFSIFWSLYKKLSSYGNTQFPEI